MGLERQHEGMGRAWELDVRGWGGDGNKCSGSRWVRGCNSNPVQNSSLGVTFTDHLFSFESS